MDILCYKIKIFTIFQIQEPNKSKIIKTAFHPKKTTKKNYYLIDRSIGLQGSNCQPANALSEKSYNHN